MFFNLPFKIPIILVLSIIFVLLIKIILKRNSSGYHQSLDTFIKRNSNANKVVKDISSIDLNFVKVNEDALPFKEYNDLNLNSSLVKKQNIVKKKLNLKMLKLDKFLTNVEIKEVYGANNFDKICLYEEHFNGFIRSLYDWAKELFTIGNLEDSKLVLKEAINIGANSDRVYILLGEIYSKENNIDELKSLLETIKNISLARKNKTFEHINNLITNLNKKGSE